MHELTPETALEHISALNDRDLLRRFVQDADEAAFADIVRRHQGLVMGVCRRVIGNNPDVDDAFQATFLTLARRPRQIRHTASLSSWLYTVAWRTSIRLVRQRRKHPVEPLTEQPADRDADTLQRIASAQDCLVLDEELNELPAKYREVLVMTYFAGQGSQQIADQLNVSKGTVDGRIRQARNMLRVRLARRGVALGTLTIVAGLSTGASAAAAPALLESTIQLGAQTLSGSVPGTTDLSHLEPLIRPEITMLSSKLLISGALSALAIVGIAGMSGLGAGDGRPAATRSETQIQTGISTATNADSNALETLPVIVNRPETVVDATFEDARSTIESSYMTKMEGSGAQRFKDYPDDAQPVERWMFEMLEKPIPPLDFPGETPLSDILETIREFYTTTYGATGGAAGLGMGSSMMSGGGAGEADGLQGAYGGGGLTGGGSGGIPGLGGGGMSAFGAAPPAAGGGAAGERFRMTIFPDTAELVKEGMTSLDEVMVSNITLQGMTLRNALTLIFERTTEPELTWVIENEVLKVTTSARAESEDSLVTRVYSVGELLNLAYSARTVAKPSRRDSRPGGFPGSGLSPADPSSTDGQPAVVSPSDLTTTIMEMTSPEAWTESGGFGTIRLVGRSLLVRQTPAVHREIVRLLNLLSESERKGK